MSGDVVEVVIKAVAGGTIVLCFAAVAQLLRPKQLAGVFSAAPSVALASVIVTAAFSGRGEVAVSEQGMIIGAVAFTGYCLAVAPLVQRWGAWRGSAAALVAWALIALIGCLVWP
jgi:hypothetical protein